MPRNSRLSRADLNAINSLTVRRFSGVYGTLAVSPLPPLCSIPRSTCVVSKKVSKRAVDRNVIKRRCREIFRTCTQGHNEPLALVFHAKKSALDASFADVALDIQVLSNTAFARYNR